MSLGRMIQLAESSLKVDEAFLEPIKSGILDIPKGKKFIDMPITYYYQRVNKMGYEDVIMTLIKLRTFNARKNPDYSKKAAEIIKALRAKYKKDDKKSA